jgi:hypothetical protein
MLIAFEVLKDCFAVFGLACYIGGTALLWRALREYKL